LDTPNSAATSSTFINVLLIGLPPSFVFRRFSQRSFLTGNLAWRCVVLSLLARSLQFEGHGVLPRKIAAWTII
jgi:hypothetical protein